MFLLDFGGFQMVWQALTTSRGLSFFMLYEAISFARWLMWVTFSYQVSFDAPLDLDWTPSMPLETFNYTDFDYSDGVYIIWRPEPDTGLRRAVYVGQGKIKPRLGFHRRTKLEATDEEAYMRATWAPVDKAMRDRVETFLAEYLRPEQGIVWPKVSSVPVNLPKM